MTQDKALKSAIRARMAESGEPYNVARRAVMADGEEDYNARYLREAEESGAAFAFHTPLLRAKAARGRFGSFFMFLSPAVYADSSADRCG